VGAKDTQEVFFVEFERSFDLGIEKGDLSSELVIIGVIGLSGGSICEESRSHEVWGRVWAVSCHSGLYSYDGKSLQRPKTPRTQSRKEQ
jgi:hypothetical protein